VQTKRGANLRTDEIIERFATYSSEQGWGMSSSMAERELPVFCFTVAVAYISEGSASMIR